MKKIIATIILLASSVSFADSGMPIPDLYNTGQDNGRNVLADGSTDWHYTLINSSDVQYPGPDTKVTLSYGFPMERWFPNNEISKWIGPRTDVGLFNEVGTYVYRITFDLSKFKHKTAVIKGLWSSDNNGTDIIINGQSTGYYTPIEAYYGMFPFEITSGFTEGINTIDFVIYNVNACAGLRVEIKGMADPKEFVAK
ncbi:MAG: hypothetical protein ABI792_06055 [bacterium]